MKNVNYIQLEGLVNIFSNLENDKLDIDGFQSEITSLKENYSVLSKLDFSNIENEFLINIIRFKNNMYKRTIIMEQLLNLMQDQKSLNIMLQL
ncbi:hypothetical protein [Companilactobacillus sp. DQM5]|uniref:hypothetical protein n=1 Tax=Companilactobacillus sp. DQM5 TaxID=3463359 RepID=UPI004057FD5D